MFEKDISQLAKPQIKGRGFIGSGNEIIETQTYYTVPEKDWEFDEDQKLSYNNPVFAELLKSQGRDINELNKGWVDQIPLDQLDEDDSEDSDDEELEDDEFDDIEEYDALEKELNIENIPMASEEDSMLEAPSILNSAKLDIELPEKSNSILSKVDTESTRDKVAAAINNEVNHNKPVIKLNIDKTSADQPVSPKPNTVIKLKPKS